jgi:hypothetical protein
MLRTCLKCQKELDLENNFSRRPCTLVSGEVRIYWSRKCKACRAGKRHGICSLCKKQKKLEGGGICGNCYFKTEIAVDPEKLKAYQSIARARHLLRKYKMTLEEYASLLVKQNGKCAICGVSDNGKTRDGKNNLPFMVDHDHLTGENRGLLCAACNFLVGLLEANHMCYEAVKIYLDKYHNKTTLAINAKET